MTRESAAPIATTTDLAADWFARRRSGQMTAQELCELQVWLDDAPEHAEAFRRVSRAWDVAGLVASEPEILAIREAARCERPARARFQFIAAGAACLLALLIGAWLIVSSFWYAEWIAPVWQHDYRTAVGQRTMVTLPDGSVLTLDTDTALHVRESGGRRLVELEQGQAFFAVAKDAHRPFVVTAEGNSVTATGTRFNVRVDPDQFRVVLLEGTVRVQTPPNSSAPGERADLVAGWQFTASKENWSVDPVSPLVMARETAWLNGRVAVIAAPLGAVVEELNRYTVKKIVVDPRIAQEPIDGVFRTGDIDGFVKLLSSYRLARVVADTGAEILLAQPQKNAHRGARRLHDSSGTHS